MLFRHFGEMRKKWPKNAQNNPSSPKIAVFRLLVNEYPIEIDRKTGNQKFLVSKMKTKKEQV